MSSSGYVPTKMLHIVWENGQWVGIRDKWPLDRFTGVNLDKAIETNVGHIGVRGLSNSRRYAKKISQHDRANEATQVSFDLQYGKRFHHGPGPRRTKLVKAFMKKVETARK